MRGHGNPMTVYLCHCGEVHDTRTKAGYCPTIIKVCIPQCDWRPETVGRIEVLRCRNCRRLMPEER